MCVCAQPVFMYSMMTQHHLQEQQSTLTHLLIGNVSFIYLLYFHVLTWIKPNGAENQAEDERDNEDEGDGDDDDDDDDDDSDDEYVEEEDDAAPSVLSKKRSIDEVVDKEAHGSKKIKA